MKKNGQIAIFNPIVALRGSMLIALTGLCVACGPQTQTTRAPSLVYAMQVADASGLSERSFPGRARAGQEVNSSFRVSGPLVALPVSVGDEVKQGDLLAQIDPRDFQSRLSTLEGQLAAVKANQQRAAADLQRIENVLKEDPGATSQTAVDRVRQLASSATAEVQSLEATVQSARDQLSYATLKAPFDGIVVDTYVENFETVLVRQPILRLLDPSSIEFVIQVPENLISLAPSVESAEVRFDAMPGVAVPALIKEIGREASQSTRTYPVTLVMNQPAGTEILPGMAGAAIVSARPPADSSLAGIEIPLTAVFPSTTGTERFVWIIDEDTNTLTKRAVTMGRLSQFGVFIDSGLTSGEWIVTKGVNSLVEGQQVKIFDLAEQGQQS